MYALLYFQFYGNNLQQFSKISIKNCVKQRYLTIVPPLSNTVIKCLGLHSQLCFELTNLFEQMHSYQTSDSTPY